MIDKEERFVEQSVAKNPRHYQKREEKAENAYKISRMLERDFVLGHY